jgi:CRISPR-associated protein Csb1
MPEALTIEQLSAAVAGRAAAFRTRAILQPAAGTGTKVFPPTYADAAYAVEKRRVPNRDEPVECVLLDSVQSQANRMEEALQQAIDNGRLRLPVIEVDFDPYFPGADQPKEMRLVEPVGKLSSLQAPHRIADAILRDSLCGGVRFRQSELGRSIDRVTLQNATPLYELCPTALLFGMWDSTGPKGGLGVKIERALVSEIIGIDAVFGAKTSSRIDPLGIARKAGPLYMSSEDGWTLDESKAKREKNKPVMLGKDGRPSEANHGNVVPSISDVDRQSGRFIAGGVTIASAEQTIVLSLPALRRLRFPINGKLDRKVDDAGRTVIAALGLCAAALADESGLDLRSRCLLYPESDLSWELLDRGEHPTFTLPADMAIDLLNKAVSQAAELGLKWREEPLCLSPSPELVKLVVNSQSLVSQKGEGADE